MGPKTTAFKVQPSRMCRTQDPGLKIDQSGLRRDRGNQMARTFPSANHIDPRQAQRNRGMPNDIKLTAKIFQRARGLITKVKQRDMEIFNRHGAAGCDVALCRQARRHQVVRQGKGDKRSDHQA